ncbi:2Fe-2S iron-sulfur cluster-binding protein [Nocardia sp. R7R-8]|uniref:2Fe-2S iron-sulfur cluster-binding protein n=1 Tax=Nocardia sp. R7R-8 TaxID=3459304 RepID=UPI00403E2493
MNEYTVHAVVNGEAVEVTIDPRRTLVSMLRDDLGLTGTHIGCKTGNCGACTVALDGLTVKACCLMAAEVDGRTVETIESLSADGELHPIQEKFSAMQALQCGFCTPGMVMSAKALLDANPTPTEDEIRSGLKGNLCRCTGYLAIIGAVGSCSRRTGS